MTPNISFTILPRFLKAAALFTSTDETRFVLRAIKVEITPLTTVLVATDGRRLIAINVTDDAKMERPAEDVSFMLPAELIATMPKEEKAGLGVRVELGTHRGEPSVSITGVREVCAVPLDGTFPSWRQVIPKTPTKPFESLNVNGRFLDSFARVNELLGGREIGLHIVQHEASTGIADGPLVIYPSVITQSWVGVLMPMRGSDHQMPKWVE